MVVIGGGVAGLAAAHRLQATGADVVLVEKRNRLGGIVETTVDHGFVIEAGPDSFVASKGAVLEMAGELGLEDQVISSNPDGQGSFVWWDERLHPLPGGLLLMVPSQIRPFLRSSLLSWKGKARALGDVLMPRSTGADDESLGSFVRRRLGAEVLDRIAEPLVAGIHAADPETMSLRAGFPRFLEMEAQHRSLILAARRLRRRPANSGTTHFASFRLGMGQLTSALASSLSRVEIRTGAGVVEMETAGGGYALTLEDRTKVTAPAIVLAVPAPEATTMLRSVSARTAAAITGVDQVTNQAVTLAYRTDQLPPLRGSGFVVPSGRGPRIRGVSYLSRKWAARVPDDEFTLLRVFFPAETIDADPVATARAELSSIVGIGAEPVRAWVRTHRRGLHRYTLGHLDRIARAEQELDGSRISLAGAGFYGVGLNECIASGRAAADSVMADLGNVVTTPDSR